MRRPRVTGTTSCSSEQEKTSAPPAAGGVLSALRYAWPLFDDGDTCCPDLASTRGHAACIPANCPVKLSDSLLPGNPFYASITPSGKCACLAPQSCDA